MNLELEEIFLNPIVYLRHHFVVWWIGSYRPYHTVIPFQCAWKARNNNKTDKTDYRGRLTTGHWSSLLWIWILCRPAAAAFLKVEHVKSYHNFQPDTQEWHQSSLKKLQEFNVEYISWPVEQFEAGCLIPMVFYSCDLQAPIHLDILSDGWNENWKIIICWLKQCK